LKVAQLGLGPIGLECLKTLVSTSWACVVGAVDIDSAKINRDLGSLTANRRLRGLRVCSSISELSQKPDLVFHTTVSDFKTAYAQLMPLAAQGINVVSSCEQMLFPKLREPQLAARLHRRCQQTGARMVGAGVNPGFVMDLLPLCLAALSTEIITLKIQRVVNASTRREPLQRKIGSGLPPSKLRQLLRAGQAGHAGLRESLALLAHGLGRDLRRVVGTSDAIVAETDIRTKFFAVKKGQACGMHQNLRAHLTGGIQIELDLKMSLDAATPHDAIQIDGTPPINLLIRGGLAGDQATVAALINIAPRLVRSPPGLHLITDLPPS